MINEQFWPRAEWWQIGLLRPLRLYIYLTFRPHGCGISPTKRPQERLSQKLNTSTVSRLSRLAIPQVLDQNFLTSAQRTRRTSRIMAPHRGQWSRMSPPLTLKSYLTLMCLVAAAAAEHVNQTGKIASLEDRVRQLEIRMERRISAAELLTMLEKIKGLVPGIRRPVQQHRR